MEVVIHMKKKIQNLVIIIIQLLIGGACGFFGTLYFESFLDFTSSDNIILMLSVFILYFYFAFFLHIIIHECGHLIFGLKTGYKFVSIRFFNFMLIKEDDKIKRKKFSLAGTGGQCLLAPPDYNNGDFPIVLYNLGGCIMNVFTSIFAMIIFLIHLNPWIDAFFIIFSLCGIGSALTNGIPLHTTQIANDGANVVALRKDHEAKKAFWIQMKINELTSLNIRLKDMPEELFDFECKDLDNQLLSTIEIFKTQRYMDLHNFIKAKELMQWLLENANMLMGIHKHILINDLIYIAIIENDNETIEKLMTKEHKKMRKALKTNLSFLRTQYAYELFLNQSAKTVKTIKDFNKFASNYPYKADVESESELINIAKETIIHD